MTTPLWAYIAMAVLLGSGILLLVTSMGREVTRPCPKCQRVMLAEWPACKFCGADPRLLSGRALLHFVTGPLADQVLVLDKAKITIGSAPGNDVVLLDKAVSRKHVGIRKVDGGFELMDFGATNGMYVNGEKIPKRMLAVGDVVRVGGTEFVFRV